MYPHLDQIYEQIVTHCGQLIAPCNQDIAEGIGNAEGVCRALTLMWIAERLKRRNPFGIDPNAPRLGPVNSDTPIARRFGSTYNNSVKVTKEIISLQNMTAREMKNYLQIAEALTAGTDHPAQPDVMFDAAYQIADTIADGLVFLGVGGFDDRQRLIGHAIGFRFKATAYECFDSNAGWFRFDSMRMMKLWFAFFWETMGYGGEFGGPWLLIRFRLGIAPEPLVQPKLPSFMERL